MILVAAALVTDIADGYLARLLKAVSFGGAIFDNIADFFLIFCIFLIFNSERIFTPLLTLTSLLSFLLYVINCFLHRQIIHTRLGLGTGVICMVTILVSCTGRIFFKSLSEFINTASSVLCIFYLILTIVENIFIILKRIFKNIDV
jgi:phosphatidylglycerophosphate synthase